MSKAIARKMGMKRVDFIDVDSYKGAPTAAAMRQAKGESVDEGIYTKDDGGAYDGLRIAKYLAHEDGHTNWKRLSYGQVQDYLDQGMEMLQRDKSKARSILAKPTPRI